MENYSFNIWYLLERQQLHIYPATLSVAVKHTISCTVPGGDSANSLKGPIYLNHYSIVGLQPQSLTPYFYKTKEYSDMSLYMGGKISL